MPLWVTHKAGATGYTWEAEYTEEQTPIVVNPTLPLAAPKKKKKSLEYMLVTAPIQYNNATDFNRKVQVYLDEGWELYGPPLSSGEHGHIAAQAMTRERQ